MPVPGEGDPETDMKALDRTISALEADGADAAAEDVAGSVDVFNALDEVAAAEAEGDEDAEEARQELLAIRDALVDIEEGDEPEMPMDELRGKLEEFHGMVAMAALKSAVAGSI